MNPPNRPTGPVHASALLALALAASVVVGCEGELRSLSPRRAADGALSDAAVPIAPDVGLATHEDAARSLDAFEAPDAAPDAYLPPVVGCDDPVEQDVIRLVNASRTSMGLGAVRCDPAMTAVAREHSSDMCARGYFSHTGLDGRDPFDRLRDGGVRFGAAGENIAQGQRSADAVHTAWMNSAGHRRNILDGDYARIGVGLDACGGDMYWTEVFAD